MTETIRIDDLTFLVKRSTRRKTIGLTIERDSSLVAHLPENVDADRAREVIGTKLTWVYRKLSTQKANARGEVFRRPEFVDGEGFYFLGKHFRLKLVDVDTDAAATPSVRFENDRLFFRRDQTAAGERRIAEYYTRAAHPHLKEGYRQVEANRGGRAGRPDPDQGVGVQVGVMQFRRDAQFSLADNAASAAGDRLCRSA